MPGRRTCIAVAGLAVALAVPSTAFAVDPSLSGPATVDEDAGTATYTVVCGDTPNPLSPPPPLPQLPAIVNTGVLSATVTDGPAPATDSSDHLIPVPPAVTCSQATPQFDVTVPILDDTTDELDEKFTLTVSGTLAPPAAPIEFEQSVVTTIVDDDVPTASIQSRVQVTEGDSGTTNATLVVTLSQAPAKDVKIAFTTENGTATAGSDFTATSGSITIPAGKTTGAIGVPVVGDRTKEAAESFFVRLTGAENAALDPQKSRGEVAVSDTDTGTGGGGTGGGTPSISIVKAVSVREGRRGTVTAAFPVKLSSASSERVRVDWRTATGTAGTRDFTPRNGTLAFEPGETSKTVAVTVRSDTRDERNETFTVVLERPVGATLGTTRSSTATIVDDDGPKMTIARPKAKPRALVTKLGCPRSADGCRGRAVATAPGLKLGRAKFTVRPGTKRKIKIRLSKRSRAALRKRGRRVTIKVTAADRSGARRVTKRRFPVKRIR